MRGCGGWHPQCFCFVTPVLVDEDEILKMNEAFMQGEKYTPKGERITEYPAEFKKWVKTHKADIAAARSKGTEPYFIRNNADVIEGILKPKQYGNAAYAGTKLGRSASKEAYKEYADGGYVTLSQEQKANIDEIAKAFGIKANPMTFEEANQGRANVNWGKDKIYAENCQSCVAIHEARLRGLNITAKAYDNNPDSTQFLLGKHFQNVWINPKNGKTPQVTVLRGKSDKDLYAKLDKNTQTKGRYHVGINKNDNSGHVIVAERMPNDKLLFYDPQNGNFINISVFDDLEYIEVLKVDKLIFNLDYLENISEVLR